MTDAEGVREGGPDTVRVGVEDGLLGEKDSVGNTLLVGVRDRDSELVGEGLDVCVGGVRDGGDTVRVDGVTEGSDPVRVQLRLSVRGWVRLGLWDRGEGVCDGEGLELRV